MFSVMLFTSCQEDDLGLDTIVVPSNITVSTIVSEDGSGIVEFDARADNAITYKYVFGNGETKVAPGGAYSHAFSESGDYTVSVVAYGTGGTSSSTTVDVSIFVAYEPPQDLIDKLVGDGSKEWRIYAEVPKHFGLGPIDDTEIAQYYGAPSNDKSGTGMYDDRYIFREDGTFVHITDNTNDEPETNPEGTVFGRINFIDELGGCADCEVQGADVLNIPYNDYTENWAVIAPGGAETIALTGRGFIGYYTGGDHRYEIYDGSIPNQLILRTTDGNNEFDWWFILTSEDENAEGSEGEESFQSQFSTEVWADEFNGDALDTDKWNYEIGNGTNGWGNGEAQYYTDSEDNVKVQDGNLIITAKREAESGFNFTSARITTKDKYEFTYGRVEVRAKLPAGSGTWPAIWMLGAEWPEEAWPGVGEMDIMEFVGNNPNRISSALHFPGNSGGSAILGENTEVTDVTSEFHVYEVEWTEDKITFLMDGESHLEFDNSDATPFNDDFYLLLNVAMGGSLGGSIADDFQESSMEIDYVKVFQ